MGIAGGSNPQMREGIGNRKVVITDNHAGALLGSTLRDEQEQGGRWVAARTSQLAAGFSPCTTAT